MKNNLKEHRKRHGLTQEEIAYFVRISKSSYQGIEAGNHEPSVYTAMRLADVLRVDLRDLSPIERETA